MDAQLSKDANPRRLRLRRVSHLANQLELAEGRLLSLAEDAGDYYIEFPRNVKGKDRLLVMAKPPLASVQKRILSRILLRLPPFSAAYGAIKGRSIKDNATVHAQAKFVAKLDVADFYPSVHREKVYGFFIFLDCSPDVARLLTQLTTRRHSLPLGVATSPMLADQIVRKVDERVSGMAKRAGLNYSRYVDDITLSGGFPLHRFCRLTARVLQQAGFRVKANKLEIYTPGDGKERIITGVRLADNGTSAPSQYIADLRRDLLEAAEASKHAQVEGHFETRDHYRGRIGYVQWLDPKAGGRLMGLYRKVKWRHLEWANPPSSDIL
jgi:RNA-directed DNA polymerase